MMQSSMDGNEIAKDATEESNVEVNGWGDEIAKDATEESNVEDNGWGDKIA